MFGFLTQQARDHPDPLLTPKTASGWLRQLPTLDVIGRQQHVMRAFDGMRQARRGADPHRVAAVEFLDSALGADRRQLIKQYVENVDTSARLAERLWQALQEMCQGFIYAYQSSLEQALAQPDNPRWKPIVPRLFSRLIHYYGTDAKLRVFRYERWIPAKWMELHKLYMRATELGVERVLVAMGSAGPNATHWTIEQEYVFVLLIHQLNDSGSMLRYLDTTPMAEQLERAIQALRQAEATDQGPAAPINQQRVAILEKVRPAISPNLNADLRRDPRIAVTIAAKVRVGLGRICRDLAAKDTNEPANDASHPRDSRSNVGSSLRVGSG